MSSGSGPTRGQLDIPLVWETDSQPEPPPPAAGKRPAPAPPAVLPASASRLMLAAFADLGVTLLAFAAAWTAAVTSGVTASTGQLTAIAVVGLEVATVVMCGMLWGWRGTPGMLLLEVAFDRPLPAGIVPRVCLAWLATLPVGGLPLLLGRAGGRRLEKLAGTPISLRQPRAGA